LAQRGGQQHIVELVTCLDIEDLVTIGIELHRDLAVAVDLDEIAELVAPAPCRAWWRTSHPDSAQLVLVFRQRHDRSDPLALFKRQHIDQALCPSTVGVPIGRRQTFSL
jgi:hypothetical protein